MNALGFLTVFFALACIGLYCVICVLFDRNEQLRQTAGAVPPSPDLQAAALDLIIQCTALEQRNDRLESCQDRLKDVVAMSMAQSRIPRRDRMRMEVTEMEGMP